MKKKASTNAKADEHRHGLSVPQSHPRSLKAPVKKLSLHHHAVSFIIRLI